MHEVQSGVLWHCWCYQLLRQMLRDAPTPLLGLMVESVRHSFNILDLPKNGGAGASYVLCCQVVDGVVNVARCGRRRCEMRSRPVPLAISMSTFLRG